MSTPHDDSPTPEPGTWIIRRRRTKRHPDQMRLPLNDLDDDVDVTRLSDAEFRLLLRADEGDKSDKDDDLDWAVDEEFGHCRCRGVIDVDISDVVRIKDDKPLTDKEPEQ